ncbi:MAG: hypothetical protein RIS64_3104 [Bacteroidota bacterium]|jgi:hypothetical protein
MLYSRNFPVGEQFFEKLRLDEAIYIDKTRFILRSHIIPSIALIIPTKKLNYRFLECYWNGHVNQQTGRMAITVLDIEHAFKKNQVLVVIEILTKMFKT